MLTSINTEEQNLEALDFSFLQSIGTLLTSSLNLKDTLDKIFETIHEYIGINRGILTFMDPTTDALILETSYGIPDNQLPKEAAIVKGGLYLQVIQSEKAVIVPILAKDPEVMKKITERPKPESTSFICLPITLGKEKIGTLSMDIPFVNEQHLARCVKLVSLFTLLIAQEVKLKRLLETEREALRSENIKLQCELKEKYNIHNMIGNSNAIQQVYESIMQVAQSNATVLIRGESGTGKELVAHAIHYNSPRANGPFIKINCGAIPESLIESELFGHEKGAFTDAIELKMGKFEAANGGTIFLDEIAELSPTMQVKLLRVLQEKEFHRIGSNVPTKVNVRVITATNRDLELELKENRFRQDLYYRLNVFPIFLPPLRERKTDILLLTEHFLEKFGNENNKKIKRLSSLAIDMLNTYHWPGNVRELENCVERAVLLCNADTIQSTHLPPTLQRRDTSGGEEAESLSLEELTANFEKEIIIDALKKTRGNKSKAARILKTTQRIIGYKIRNLKVDIRRGQFSGK